MSEHAHCYCQSGIVGSVLHNVCCKCGDRVMAAPAIQWCLPNLPSSICALMAAFGIMVLSAVGARASEFSVNVSTSFNPNAMVGWDFIGKDLQYGIEKDILLFNDSKIGNVGHLGWDQLFDARIANVGSTGADVGINLYQFGAFVANGFEAVDSNPGKLNWIETLGSYTSIDGFGGYRFASAGSGLRPWNGGVSGKVQIPVDQLIAWIESWSSAPVASSTLSTSSKIGSGK